MTMTDSSPPPSPSSLKCTENETSPVTESVPTAERQLDHPTLPPSAIHKSLYYVFPTPPQSPHSPTRPPVSPRIPSPRSSTFRRPRSTSRTVSTHTRRRSSLSTSFHISQLIEAQYGPPPHPAPTAPLPPTPGAPRIPFTTPAQERNRYSSYELYDKLALLDKHHREKEARKKRHSAPALRAQLSLPLPTPASTDFRRTMSDTAARMGCYDPQLYHDRRRSSVVSNRRSGIKLEGEL